MDTEEPAWKAELRGTLEALTEWASEKGPDLTKAGLDLVLSHIEAAEQRGRQEALNALKGEIAAYRVLIPDLKAGAAWKRGYEGAFVRLGIWADSAAPESP